MTRKPPVQSKSLPSIAKAFRGKAHFFRTKLFWKLFLLNFVGISFVIAVFAGGSILLLHYNFQKIKHEYLEHAHSEISRSVGVLLDEKLIGKGFRPNSEQGKSAKRRLISELGKNFVIPLEMLPVFADSLFVLTEESQVIYHGKIRPRHSRKFLTSEKENAAEHSRTKHGKENPFNSKRAEKIHAGQVSKFQNRVRELMNQKKTEKTEKESSLMTKFGALFGGRFQTDDEDDLDEISVSFTRKESGKTYYVFLDEKRFYLGFARGKGIVSRQERGLYWILLVCLGISFLLTFLINRILMKNIHGINAGLKAVESKNFSVRIPVKSKDELGQLAEKFNNMAESIEKFEMGRQAWISEISHEMNTPLAIIKGEIEAMNDGVREKSTENLNSVLEEANHLKKITEDLKLLSVAESERLRLNLNTIPVLEYLNDFAHLYEIRLKERGLEPTFNLKVESGKLVEMDGEKINRVLRNIFENCLRYSVKPGEVFFSASLCGENLVLEIEDSGPGVAPELMETLFERFYRVEDSRNRKTGGTGLGLAICRSLMNLHRGSIAALPGNAGGLKIKLTLPLKQT